MKVKCSRFITDWVSPNRTLRKLLAATHNRSKQAWAECFNLLIFLLIFPSLQNKPCQCFALISAAQCATPGAMLEPRWVDTNVCPCWGQSNLHDFTGLEPRWKLIPVRNREGCKWDQVKARCLRHRWDLINPLALNMWSKALWASDSVLCRHGQLAERQVSRCGDDGDLITFDGTKMFGGFFFLSWTFHQIIVGTTFRSAGDRASKQVERDSNRDYRNYEEAFFCCLCPELSGALKSRTSIPRITKGSRLDRCDDGD